ncbi:MAG TPA: aminotransferase class IV [Gemmataceae bacterium]|nr:aminotransferase class IV [Gemmataceae bacterium]
MQALANLNGEQMPLEEARVPALDRGFLFGDAVYEVLRVYGGRPWLVDEHFHRLANSLQAIRLIGVDLKRLRRRMDETITAGPFREAIVYIQITRGAAPRSHKFPIRAVPLEFLYVDEFHDPYERARREGAKVVTQPDRRWDRCDIKSTNLLGNILAMQAASEVGCLEALLYLPDGRITEGTHTSVFGVRDGKLLTTPQSADILPGITRSLIFRLARRAAVEVEEGILRRDGLSEIAELFLTGTTSEILPIVSVDGTPVGTGLPGPITRRLQQVYADAVGEFIATGKAP